MSHHRIKSGIATANRRFVRILVTAFAVVIGASNALAADAAAGGIKVDTDPDEALEPYTSFTILFPEPMVAPDRIDAADVQSPLAITPALDAEFRWRTQSMGMWRINGPRIPGQTYRFRLRDGLTDLAGNFLPAAEWGLDLTAPGLEVSEEYGERERLSARPQVPLMFNFPMDLRTVADGVWFQNRATRQRFPAEVMLNYAAGESGDAVDVTEAELPIPSGFRVRPRDSLPVGQAYDLVVENPRDATGGGTLAYPNVFALGTTRPLVVDYVAARNRPREKPMVEVKFDVPLADGSPPNGALTFDPPVSNLRLRKEGQYLYADGDFNTTQRYIVTISDEVRGNRGFPLAAPSRWGATFRPKEATLMFPGGVIRQRTALGLRFALLQANTGPVTWQLARIPLQRLAELRKAAAESTTTTPDPAPNLLIDRFGLDVIATGEIDASTGDREEFRRIEWIPDDPRRLSGPFVIEATARDSEGRTIANSAFLSFNELVFTQKTSADTTYLHLASMAAGEPQSDIPVRVVTAALTDIASATTDASGTAAFPADVFTGASYFIADTPDGPAVELTGTTGRFPSGSFSRSPRVQPFLGIIVPDRPLYRPGQNVSFKGFLRTGEDEGRRVPKNSTVTWEILAGGRDEILATGTAKLSPSGGWDGAWTVPERGRLGGFQIRCKIDGQTAGTNGNFTVEEFRTPAFSVVVEPVPATSAATSSISVASQYFHGAPNVGSAVTWTATWIGDHEGDYYSTSESDGFMQVDLYSERRTIPSYEVEVSGEAVLDENGRVTLTTTAPFNDPGNRAHASVIWRVDITGPDGQTISGGLDDTVTMNDVTLGVRADDSASETEIGIDLRALPRVENGPVPSEVRTELFRVDTKTVKERIAPFVYRYRNTDVFVPIEQRTAPANSRIVFQPRTPGRYVLTTAPLAGETGMMVSAEIFLTGPGEAELPVRSDETLTIQRADAADTPLRTGDTAAFQILAPSAGIAWVTVETDRILDTFTVPLAGNSSRIEIPVKPEYAPNAFVTAYVLRPGGSDDLPGEMFGWTELEALNPVTELDVAVSTEQPDYQPRETIKGEVRVTSNGQPVEGAELAISAVDDAILELGGWSLAELHPIFYPERSFGVTTHPALTDFVRSFEERSLTQKGVVIGGGGKDAFGNVLFTRQDFRPLILWHPSVKTNAEGVASFDCEAPDNLTRFRVAVLGQTARGQFGSGDTTFTTSKPLLLETALPRFVRQGDTIELRVVARQKAADSLELTVECEPGPGVTLEQPGPISVTASRDQPNVVRFPATIADDATSITVRFAVASDSGLGDSVEITLPVEPPSIVVREATAGAWSGPGFSPASLVPTTWQGAEGTASATLSTSDYLTKLLGVPQVLDYPHGCFEQKSSRLLVYTALARLLAWVPTSADRDANYRAVIESSLQEFSDSILPDDTLPYWPNGTAGNFFVTIQIAWATAEAVRAGFTVPSSLDWRLSRALEQFVERKSRLTAPPTIRAFALFALAQFDREVKPEVSAAAEELFLNRDRLTDEGRAMLAVAFHRLEILQDHQQTLIDELPASVAERDFDATTFSSTTRAEAIITWARLLIAPDVDTAPLKSRLDSLLESSASLSTQENLWLLIAFNELLSSQTPARLSDRLRPAPVAISPNATAAEWTNLDLARLADFTIGNLAKSARGTWMMTAHRAVPPAEQVSVDQGMRVERTITNLTDPARTGTAETPFRLGDQLLISFRMYADKPQAFVSLEDALPAGIEIVNPNLALFAKTYRLPLDTSVPSAQLSYSELRDTQTNLYFDTFPVGAQSASVLARVTAAGDFTWPSTRLTPMYDSRQFGRSAPSRCVVSAE